MNVRHLVGALALSCACLAAEQAVGQDRSAYGPQDPKLQQIAPRPAPEPRLPIIEEPQRARITMIESWQVGDKGEVGLGRFSVGPIPRRQTHTERVRDDMMARDNRSIAGAGLRIRFH